MHLTEGHAKVSIMIPLLGQLLGHAWKVLITVTDFRLAESGECRKLWLHGLLVVGQRA